MSEKKFERERFAVPGSRLGVIEEFTAGIGTREVDGVIYSYLTGNVTLNPTKRHIYVTPVNAPILPSEDQNVTGLVTSVHEKMAVVDIIKIENRFLPTAFTGFLQISASSPRYERSMIDVCRTLDLIRAKVASTTDGIVRLTTVGNSLGVLKAYCSNCGYILSLRRKVLKCERCSNTEKRKLADDYAS